MSDPPKNKDIGRLYMMVGEAISTWVLIEIQLHQLFSISLSLVIMQPGRGFSFSDRGPSAVLDAIDGFRAQLLMIDAALATALEGLDEEADKILLDWAVERKK